MTFDQIQKLLGETTTNTLTEMLMRLNHASDEQTCPTSHNRALREFLTTMLAYTVVSAPDDDAGTDTVSQTSGRFEEIANEMFELLDDERLKKPVIN